MQREPERNLAAEREEIQRHIQERPEDHVAARFHDGVGRAPIGPARGWRRREQKAKSCERCEGDLWIEEEDGATVPCDCRERRAASRARNRLLAGDWWHGTSLSFAAPPLALIPAEVRDRIEATCAAVKAGGSPSGLWLVGGAGSGKSALCAYMAQRLYPTGDAIVERVGDLLAHLRWLGGVRGELAVEQRLESLSETPLLVLDNVDRAVRSRLAGSPFGFQASCASHDLIRLAGILRDRAAALRPIVVTSRAAPNDCASQISAVTPGDLVRGLLGIVADAADPFEDFPAYTEALLRGALDDVVATTTAISIDPGQSIEMAA